MLRLRLAAPSVIIDLGGIAELRGIREDGDRIAIGAMAAYHDVLRDDLVKQHVSAAGPGHRARSPTRRCATAARSAARWRTPTRRATSAPWRSRWTPSSSSLGSGGTRTVPASEFFVDYFTTAIGEDEILTEIRFPKYTGWSTHYEKFNRTAQAWSMVRDRGRAARSTAARSPRRGSG